MAEAWGGRDPGYHRVWEAYKHVEPSHPLDALFSCYDIHDPEKQTRHVGLHENVQARYQISHFPPAEPLGKMSDFFQTRSPPPGTPRKFPGSHPGIPGTSRDPPGFPWDPPTKCEFQKNVEILMLGGPGGSVGERARLGKEGVWKNGKSHLISIMQQVTKIASRGLDVSEKKSKMQTVTIGLYCKSGRHRSVAAAEILSNTFALAGYSNTSAVCECPGGPRRPWNEAGPGPRRPVNSGRRRPWNPGRDSPQNIPDSGQG